MEIIGVILAILFALVTAGDRKKKAANRAAGLPQRPGMKPVARGQAAEAAAGIRDAVRELASRPAAAPAEFEGAVAELKQRLAVQSAPAAAQGESMLADEECAGGSMPHDHAEGGGALEDAECAGGSMAHTHSEGVSRADQTRRLAALDQEEQARGNLFPSPSAIDARAMRRAVVMAEVLGRPRALQPRRRAG